MSEPVWKSALITSLAALVLAGCGGNEDPITPSEPRSVFKISNRMTASISRVSIRDAQTDFEYYAGNLDCAAGRADCRIVYTGPPIAGPTNVLFENGKAMVAAYRLATAPGKYVALEVTRWATGAYLIDRLLLSSPEVAAMSQAERESRAYTFTRYYDSADGATDYSEEIAANYAYRVRTSGMTVPQYLADLASRLLDSETAGADEFDPPVLAAAARATATTRATALAAASVAASESTCSPVLSGFLTIFGSVASGVANAYPIAGGVMSAAVGLGQSACDDTSSKLDAIDSKLNDLQLSLNSLSDSVGELRNFTSQAAINTGEDAFLTLARNVEDLASEYRALKFNAGVESLREYVDRVGGNDPNPLAKALAVDSGGPLADMLDKLKPVGLTGGNAVNPLGGGVLSQFDSLMQSGKLDTVVNAVKMQCDNPQTGDVVKLRVNCNLFLGTSVARLVAAQRLAKEMANDVYDLFDAYKATDRAIFTSRNFVITKSAADYRTALNDVFTAQANTLVSLYRERITGNPVASQVGMYDTYRGLGSDLLEKISIANCRNSKLDAVAVTGWVKSAADEYLVTQCRDMATPVLARYFLRLNGSAVNSRTSICNLLGVLMPCSRLDSTYYDNRNDWVFGLGYHAPLALRMTPGMPLVGYFAVSPNYNRDRTSKWIATKTPRTFGDGLRPLTNPEVIGDTGVADLTYARVAGHVSGDMVVNWMRYTHADRFNVVFGLSSARSLGYYIGCVTADCSTGDRWQAGSFSLDRWIDFVQGPKGLSLTSYGAQVTSPDWLSLGENARLLHGFCMFEGDRCVPIYPKSR